MIFHLFHLKWLVYVTGENKCKSQFSPTWDRARSAGLSPALYRVSIKAGFYRKAIQVCTIPIPGDIYDSVLCIEAMIISSTVRVGFKI